MMTPLHILALLNTNDQFETIKIRVWGKKPKKEWNVCYQDEGQDMTWENFKDKSGAKESYKKYEGKKARVLSLGSIVVEKDGDVKMTDEMKIYA